MTYDEGSVQMHPGEIFIAYSDGVTEPENDFGEFGEERLIDLVGPTVASRWCRSARSHVRGRRLDRRQRATGRHHTGAGAGAVGQVLASVDRRDRAGLRVRNGDRFAFLISPLSMTR